MWIKLSTEKPNTQDWINLAAAYRITFDEEKGTATVVLTDVEMEISNADDVRLISSAMEQQAFKPK